VSPSELSELAKEVLPLVQEAGGIAHSYFCSQTLRIDTKGDGSPVTQADRETEERLRLRLAALGNSFGMIGEEFGEEGADREFVWVIDPIDGTRAFTRGLPCWALLLALLHRGQPVMGFLLGPALGVLASAWKGGGTFINGLPVRVSRVASLRQSLISMGSLEVLDRQPWRKHALGLMGATWHCRSHGESTGYLELMRGRCDAVIEPEASLWDLAALKILVEEAGGKFTSLQGQDTAAGGSALATNGLLHDEILRGLRGE
jgi:histidinol-phosphatase